MNNNPEIGADPTHNIASQVVDLDPGTMGRYIFWWVRVPLGNNFRILEIMCFSNGRVTLEDVEKVDAAEHLTNGGVTQLASADHQFILKKNGPIFYRDASTYPGGDLRASTDYNACSPLLASSYYSSTNDNKYMHIYTK